MSIDSGKAVTESSWVGLVLGWINADISVTAASSDSWFWCGTSVVHVEGLADSGWVTSVEDSGVSNSSDSSVQSDRGTLSLACSEGDWGGWNSVDVKSSVASDGEVSSGWWWWWGDGGVGNVAVVGIVTAASVDLVITPDWLTVVVKLKRVTDRVWNTVVGVDLVSVDDSGEGRALSVTWDLGSDADGGSVDLVSRRDTGVAHQLVSWGASWEDSWIDTGVGVTAASSYSILKSGALVVHLQVTADAGWIAGVESGSSGLSVELRCDGYRDTLSLAGLPSGGTVSGSVDEKSRVARDWSIVEWGEWESGVNNSVEMGLGNVAVISIVTAASSEFWIVWLHAGAGIVEFERTAESVWNTSEEGNVVVGNTGID